MGYQRSQRFPPQVVSHPLQEGTDRFARNGMLENSGDDSPIFHIPDPSQNVEEYVIAKDFVERFLETLPLKDRQIVELRQDGFTYEEIADKLGYKNHSGVIKRVEAVKKKLQKVQMQRMKATQTRRLCVAFLRSSRMKRGENSPEFLKDRR